MPIILFSLIGGVVADRIDRRKIIVSTQLGQAAIAISLALLSLTGLIQVWHIYLAVFLNNTFTSASGPARQAVVATVVPRQHLVNATALTSLVQQTNGILAPAIAGFLIAFAGTAATYGINGVTCLVNATTLMLVTTSLVPPRRDQKSPLHDLTEGLHFVAKERSVLLVIMLMDLAALGGGSFIVLLPLIAGRFDVGAAGFGLLSSAPAVGSFLAATVLLSMGDFRHKGLIIAGGFVAYGTSLAGLGLAPWFPLALVAAVGLGLSDSLQGITRNAIIQILSPDEFRGRVQSLRSMMILGGSSIGQGILGGLASVMGPAAALASAGAFCILVNLSMVASRKDLRSRDLGVPVDAPPVGAPAR